MTMNLPHPDTTDALLEEHYAINVMTEPPVRAKVWGTADYEDEIERLTIELISAQHATKVAGETIIRLRRNVANLNAAAEAAAATWECKIRAWQIATVAMGAALIMVVGGWWLGLSR